MDKIGGTGPQPIPEGQGKKHLQMIEPFRLVSFDAAAFDWLWRIVELRHRQHEETASQGGVHELQAEVSKRAVIAFREAAGTLGPPPNTNHRKRRLVRGPKT